jgi:undecaprenyl diphosphate synthase
MNPQPKLPQHIAIVCDGNRRWAKQKGKPEFFGHRYAVETTVENLVDHAIKLKIPYLTFWFFSTENWRRGEKWVKKFFNLFRHLLPQATDNYLKKGVKFNTIGDLSKLPQDIKEAFLNWQNKSKNNQKITVTIAFNYGGRDEIIRAIKTIPAAKLKSLTLEKFSQYLDTKDLPDPDLLIRTGENNTRLSGFMVWQIAYTQLYFANTLFPDLTPDKLDQAITWWQTQTKNLGK